MTALEPLKKSADVQDEDKFIKTEPSLLLQQATTLLIEAMLEVIDDPENKDQAGRVSNNGVER